MKNVVEIGSVAMYRVSYRHSDIQKLIAGDSHTQIHKCTDSMESHKPVLGK
jgi:hypothetical protein